MSSANVIAPTSIGIQKLLTRAKVKAVTESTANVVIQGTGFMVVMVVVVDDYPLSEGVGPGR